MKTYEIIFSGFGGQGILFIGQLLSYAANNAGKAVSWLPAYGPEMRGGTANCMVVISDEAVNSPYVMRADALVAMNKPSVARFEQSVKPGGLLVANKDMLDARPARSDITILEVMADSDAESLGNSKVSNMVALGAFLGESGLFNIEEVADCLDHLIPLNRADLMALNKKALEIGYKYGVSGKEAQNA